MARKERFCILHPHCPTFTFPGDNSVIPSPVPNVCWEYTQRPSHQGTPNRAEPELRTATDVSDIILVGSTDDVIYAGQVTSRILDQCMLVHP